MDRTDHRSLWDDTLPPDLRQGYAPLGGDVECDVAIVGAGFTGLWTAYHLARADPTLRITVLDREHVGFGASGRNGGWCSALLPMSIEATARRHGRGAAVRMQHAMFDTLADITGTCERESIDADITVGGTVDLVRNDPQHERATHTIEIARSFGFGDEHLRWMDRDEASAVCGATRVRGAVFTPHCAAVHPGKLVHGLASAVVKRGVTIHEHTVVERIDPGRVTTARGRVRAEVVVRATEGYTAGFRSARRELVPLYSMMIATAPLSDPQWRSIGLESRPTFADGRHTVIYGQRTADGRIAFGGRGAPYHFGSRIEPSFDTDRRVRDALTETLHELFPTLADTEITHHWGGPLGVPRDLHPTVRFDRRTGLAVAGGYVGDGVATTHLAGRTLADLVTGADTELVRLPWVGHRSRRWEPEPLRWLGVNLVRSAAGAADRAENGTGGLAGRPLGTVVRRVLRH